MEHYASFATWYFVKVKNYVKSTHFLDGEEELSRYIDRDVLDFAHVHVMVLDNDQKLIMAK